MTTNLQNSVPRAAVLGTGFIGPVHLEGLRRAQVDVVAMIGSTPEKSLEAKAKYSLSGNHRTLEDVLADSTIDAVHVATPNRFHFEQAVAVLRAGKHVLCEKPLAMNAEESAELVALAESCRRVAGVAYNIRFYPLCLELAQRVRDGVLGELLHVNGAYVQDWLLWNTDFNWRVSGVEGGELRAIADIGTHWLDLIQAITGKEIVSVCADLRTVHPVRYRPVGGAETFTSHHRAASETEAVSIDTEDCGAVLFRMQGGANGCLWVSQTTAGKKNCLRFEIAGARGSASWDSESPNEMWIGSRSSSNELLVRDPALLSPAAAAFASYPGGHAEGFPDTFKQLFRAFYGYIRQGDWNAPCPFPTFEDGHREIVLCDAILKSHRQRIWVDVAST